MLTDYRHRANARGYRFDLSLSEFIALVTSPCTYCGSDPEERTMSIADRNLSIGYLSNGIDRLDSNFGYTLENSVSCCSVCNIMKSSMTYDTFIAHVQKILTKQIG